MSALRKTVSPNSKPKRRNTKAQSAVEYLTTYGWAILILTIVGVIFFSLVVLKSSSSTSIAYPGGCQVYRPNGPGTITSINLEGACNNLKPKFVSQFNGAGSVGGFAAQTYPPGTRTVSLWALTTSSSRQGFIGTRASSGGSAFLINKIASDVSFYQTAGSELDVATSIPLNIWTMWTYTLNTTTGALTIYKNGASIGSSGGWSSTDPAPSPACNGEIGNEGCSSYITEYFSGLISNVQIYNTAFSANEVQALYAEGIGGAPIVLQNLAWWWPLNGDANDYSGNANNANTLHIVMNSTWVSGYTGP